MVLFLMPEFLKISAEPVFVALDYHINHCLNVFIEPIFLSQSSCVLQQRATPTIEFLVSLAYVLLLLFRKACSGQTSLIDAAHFRRIMTAHNQKWGNIVIDARKARRLAPFANGHKLMQQNHTTQPDAGLNPAVPAYLNVVAHNDFVFQYAVVADVHANHKQIIISYRCYLVRVYTRMDCHLLANDVPVSDHKAPEFGIGT
jgi:hypothetical protein